MEESPSEAFSRTFAPKLAVIKDSRTKRTKIFGAIFGALLRSIWRKCVSLSQLEEKTSLREAQPRFARGWILLVLGMFSYSHARDISTLRTIGVMFRYSALARRAGTTSQYTPAERAVTKMTL